MARSFTPETLRRRAAAAAQERQLVIEAATRLFGSRGYHETSIREIAAAAGFSIGALYQRFESKDALYGDVVEQHFGRIWAALDAALESHTEFVPRLLAVTSAFFHHVVEHRTFLRMYELHRPTIAEPYQTRIEQMRKRERSRSALVTVFTQGKTDGYLGDEDPDLLGTMYYGMLNRLALRHLSNRRPLPTPERLAAIFLNGAAAGGAKRVPRITSAPVSTRPR